MAAIPPTFLPYDNAVGFYRALSSSELANATLRLQIGELASALYLRDKRRSLRSISELANLLSLSKNESACTQLRQLSKCLDEAPATHSATAATSAAAAVHAGSSLYAGSGELRVPAEDAVRFSTAVQSQLYDVNAAPNETTPATPAKSAASGAGVPSPRRKLGGGDSKRRGGGPRGGGPADKPPVPAERGRERSKQRRAQRLPDRSRNVPSSGMEKSRRKSSHKPAV